MKAVSNELVRLNRTAADFESVGLAIISYYLRLYAVELILQGEESRSPELTQLATTLLDKIEDFKNAVKPDEGEDGHVKDSPQEANYTLIHDQSKAKMYVLSFTMTLYNEKLIQIKEGRFDADLKRALWCCIDLFSCVLHLWNEDLKDEVRDSLKKRVKLCKVYLSKLARGELGAAGDDQDKEESGTKELDYSDFISPDNVDDLAPELKEGAEDKDEKVEAKVRQDTTKEEIDALLDDMRAESESKEDEEENVDRNDDDEDVPLSLPEAPSFIPKKEQEAKTIDDVDTTSNGTKGDEDEAPSFIDSETEEPFQDTTEEPDDLSSIEKRIEDEAAAKEAAKIAAEQAAKEAQLAKEIAAKEAQLAKDVAAKESLKVQEAAVKKAQEIKVAEEEEQKNKIYSQLELQKMMDRGSKIETIQKMAKYAISALNYEDIPTARDELSNALELLNTL